MMADNGTLTTWATIAHITEDWFTDTWPQASTSGMGDSTITMLLDAARTQCVDWLGKDPETITPAYRLAQLLQARALARSADAGDTDQIGPDGLAVTVFPMDWTVKRLLRPERRIGGIA